MSYSIWYKGNFDISSCFSQRCVSEALIYLNVHHLVTLRRGNGFELAFDLGYLLVLHVDLLWCTGSLDMAKQWSIYILEENPGAWHLASQTIMQDASV